jgi:hypothetical protein
MNNEPVAWAMFVDGNFYDCISPEEHNRHKNKYTTPLYTHPEKTQDGCGNCHACLVNVMENGLPITSQRMILCPECGNKRCPKASNHRYQCTGSNEIGQIGSIYTHPAKTLTDEEIQAIAKESYVWNTGKQEWSEIEFARAILKKATEK